MLISTKSYLLRNLILILFIAYRKSFLKMRNCK